MFILSDKHSLLHPYKQKRISKVIKEPLIAISFDDGSQTDYVRAYTIMEPLGIRGTSFINTGAVGGGAMLKWWQIQEMRAGGWDFQCHGHNHTRWSDFVTEQEMRNQLESVDNAFIAQGLPAPKHHAWPYGISTPEAKTIIAEYRLTQRSTGFLLGHNNDYKTALPYLRGFGGDTQYGDTEKYNLNMDFIRDIYDLHKIGIFYFHAFTNDQQATSGIYEPYFVDYINYILDLGIRVVTISQLYNLLINQ